MTKKNQCALVFNKLVCNTISISKGYSPPTAAPTMHDTFLDVIGSNSATFLSKDANLLMFNTVIDSSTMSELLFRTHL